MIQYYDFRFSYIMKTTELLIRLKNISGLVLSVSQCAIVSKCIEFIVSFGFIPCLIPSVWISVDNKQKHVIQFTEDISPNMVLTEKLYSIFKCICLKNKQ